MSMNKQITLEDVMNQMIQFNEQLHTKIGYIENNILKLSEKIENKLGKIESQLIDIECENNILQAKLKETERKIKSKNLIFYGIEEQEQETTAQIFSKISKVIINKLEIRNFCEQDISNSFRLGKKINTKTKTRPILVEFLRSFQKQEVVKNLRKLKGSKLSVSEDLSLEDREERKALISVSKKLKETGRNTKLKGGKLEIDGEILSLAEISEKYADIIIEGNSYYSPPPKRLTNSEPATPVTQIENCFSEEEPSKTVDEEVEQNTEKQKLVEVIDEESKKNTSPVINTKEEKNKKSKTSPGKRATSPKIRPQIVTRTTKTRPNRVTSQS